jgi:centromeric protein E
MLQPSLAGNARISVVCTINPDPSALAESLSTLGFAKRVKGVQVDTSYFSLHGICTNHFVIVERKEEGDSGHRGSFGKI